MPWAAALSALTAGAVLLGAASISAFKRRHRVQRALRLLGSPVAHLNEGVDVTVEGALRLSGGRFVTRVPAGSETPVRAVLGAQTEPVESAVVEISSDRAVELDAGAQIVVGTTERSASGGGIDQSIEDGSTVRARGRIERQASADPKGGYRTSAHVFRFASQDSPTVVVALNGPRSRTAPSLAVLGFAAIGAAAALTPSAVNGPRASDCAARIEALLARNDVMGLTAVTCDDPLASAHADFARGDFAQAHRHFRDARTADRTRTPTVAEIQSAALAHDFGVAGSLTLQLAKAWYPGPEASERQRLVCVADAYASRVASGGRVGSLERPLRADAWCNYLAGDLETDHEARMWRLQCDDDDYDTRRLLFLEAGARRTFFSGLNEFSRSYIEDYPLGALYDPAGWISKRHIELENSVATASDAGGGTVSYELLAQAALFHAVVGARDATRGLLARLDRPGGDRTPYILGAIAALYVGDARSVERMLELGRDDSNAVAVIRGSALPLLSGEPGVLRSAEEPWNASILAALSAHDADALARAFASDHRTHRYEALRARAVFASSELGPVRKWLREGFPAPAWDHGVWAVGLRLADQLAVAEALDDTALASVLRPRVAAFAAAIGARTPTTPRNDDPTFANDLLERVQDKPAEVWRTHR